MRALPGVVIGLAVVSGVLTPSPAAPAAPHAARRFAGWTATCNNLRDCVAIASSDDGDGLFYLRIAVGARAADRPSIKVVFATGDPIPGAADVFHLSLERGGADNRYTVTAIKADPDGAARAGEVKDVAFLPALTSVPALGYTIGPSKGKLPLEGLTRALSFIDDVQGRSGTVDAILPSASGVSRQMPAPPAPTAIVPAAWVAQPVASPLLSRALLDMAKASCDPEVVEAHADAAAWTVGADRILVAVPCAEAAYNVSAALFLTDASGGRPKPAMLEQPTGQGDAQADNVVVNFDFDPKTLTLTSLDKARGLGDCGETRSWVWTGDLFALLKAAEMTACPGALPEDWPSIFSANRQ